VSFAAAGGFVVLLLFCGEARAYPAMIRHAYFGCTTCHADPSGGELLTMYGRAQGNLLLRMRYGAETDPHDEPSETAVETNEESHGPVWGLLAPPSWLLIGGGYRHALLYEPGDLRTFPMQLDLYGELRAGPVRAGGTIGGARVPAGSPYASAAQVTSNEGGWNLVSRTHWIGVDLGRAKEVTVRAGRLNLPFGVRVPEHILWARVATRTDRESAQQHGLAVALDTSWLRGELMAIAGNFQVRPDEYRERGYSGYAEILASDGLAVGASSAFTVARADRYTLVRAQTARGAHGPFARVSIAKPVVLLVEADVLDTGRRELGYVGFVQLDVEPIQGLHVGGTGEVLDQGYADAARRAGVERGPGNGKPRFGGWGTIDWFFLPQFQARFDAIMRQESELWLLGQLHVYL
jgi:hypothetical protein